MKAVALSWLLVLSFTMGAAAAQPAELRGIWLHATQVKTPAQADAAIAKIEQARFNAVFLLVWYWGGQAFFNSSLAPLGEGVAPGYDPLAYMIDECHKRHIEVHAWFVNGSAGTAGERKYILSMHPDWAVDDGTGSSSWYDFAKPDVRRYQSDLMIECMRHYNVDGIHFDYIRYGPHQCYCQYCQKEFASRYGGGMLTPEEQASFPAGVGVTANTVIEPTSAKVLATFSDGTPAITLNLLDKGVTLLLNWHAEIEMPPAVAKSLDHFLNIWTLGATRPVYITTTNENRGEYGTESLEAARAVLARLGYTSRLVPIEQLNELPVGCPLVLSAMYLIPFQVSKDLERFVRIGGRIIFIDGPAKSMHLGPIQHITGLSQAGPYLHRDEVIESTGVSPLVPKGKHAMDVMRWKYRMQRWGEFRKWGVSELVRDVYRRAKKLKPKVQVTAAVVASLESADSMYQEWPRWLRDKTIDYVIPMAYTADTTELLRQLSTWKTVDRRLDRIIPGLAIYQEITGQVISRRPDLVRDQVMLSRQQGAHGNTFFSLPYLDDSLMALFRSDLYPEEAPAYVPAPYRPVSVEPQKEPQPAKP